MPKLVKAKHVELDDIDTEAIELDIVESPKGQSVAALCASINKKFGKGGRVVIQQGKDIEWASAERWTTGSLGLDIALNGGLPKGMITQYMGEESSGKTTMTFKTAADIQRQLGDKAAIAYVSVEGFDKQWANMCGCSIAFSPAELKLMPPKERDIYSKIKTVGDFVVSSANTGEDALELMLEFIRSKQFQFVVLDSVAALVPAAEEEREMSENTMGKNPALIGKFLRKAGPPLSQSKQTSVVLINQVRDPIGVYGHPEPQPTGGRALRHWCQAIVRFRKGELQKEIGEDKEKFVYAKRTKIKIEKCKVGPAFREAEFDFYFQEYNGFKPGEIDHAQETRIHGVKSGVIRQVSNLIFEIDGEVKGRKAEIDTWLRAHPDQRRLLDRAILAAQTTGVQR